MENIDLFCQTMNTLYISNLNYHQKKVVLLSILGLKKDKIQNDKQHLYYMLYTYFNPIVLSKQKDTLTNFCIYYAENQLSNDIIKKLFYTVYNKIVKEGLQVGIDNLNTYFLRKLFEIVDEVYFANHLKKYFKSNSLTVNLNFKVGNKNQTKIAGYCSQKKKEKICYYTVNMGKDIITKPFDTMKTQKANGIVLYNPLEVLINIFLHEITHLIIFTLCPEFNVAGGHSHTFKKFCKSVFGQTDFRHNLGQEGDLIGVTKEEIKGWKKIQFKHGDKTVIANIVKLNPTKVKAQILNLIYTVPYTIIYKKQPK